MYKIIGADGREYGPISAEQLRLWIAEGRANAETMAKAEGATDWQTIGSLPEFAEATVRSTLAVAPPPAPSARPGAGSSAASLPNYLVQSILCTIFCCMPFGIPAIVYAAQVNSKVAAGDLAGATESSQKAKMWCWISFGLGLVLQPLRFFFMAKFLGNRHFHI